MKGIITGVVLCILMVVPFASLSAKKGELIHTPMKMYDKTVPLITVTGLDILKTYIQGDNPSAYNESEYRLTKLSKESLDTIAAYYKSLMTVADKIVEIVPAQDNEYMKGYEITFNDMPDSDLVQVATVKIVSIDYQAKIDALGQYSGGDTSAIEYSLMPFPLMMMSMSGPMYGHTDKEISDLKKKYIGLSSMFYRSYQKDIEEDTADDYNKTIMLAYQKVSGANKKMTPKQFEKWLQTQGMAAAGKLMKKEAWPIWMDCLVELDKLAYPVKIIHEGSTYWK